MEILLEPCRRTTGGAARLVWAGERFLVDPGVEPFQDLPLWLAPAVNRDHAGFLAVDGSKALAAGLSFRPLEDTVRDTLAGAELTDDAGLAPERERELLAA